MTAGYCRLHRSWMTWGAIRRCGCVDSQKQHERGREECRYLKPNAGHPMWKKRRKSREIKRLKKAQKEGGANGAQG